MGTKGANKIYGSPYHEMVENYLDSGMTPEQITNVLASIAPTFAVSIPTIYAFKKRLEEDREKEELATVGGTVDPEQAIKYDGMLLDLIINQGMDALKLGELRLTVPMVLKAMEMKKELLGVEYRGQTVWGLLDSQKQFDELVEIIHRRCPADVFEQIIEDLKELGWATTAARSAPTDSMFSADFSLSEDHDY